MSYIAPKSIEIKSGGNIPSFLGTTMTEIRTSSWSCSSGHCFSIWFFGMSIYDNNDISPCVALLCSPDRQFENSIS